MTQDIQSKRKRKILQIVEFPDAGDTLGRMLLFIGHTRIVTYNKDEGILLAQSEQPDIIVIELPNPMEGYFEFIAVLRKFYSGPIIAVSSGDPDEAIKAGCNY